MALRNFQDGQEITYQDLNGVSKAVLKSMWEKLAYELLQRNSNAFIGDGFKVAYSGPTSITVGNGLGFYTDSGAVSPESKQKALWLGTTKTVNLTAPNASNDRIDIVVVSYGEIDELTATRKYKDASTSAVSSISAVVQKDLEATIQIIAGTPSGSPVAPSVPAGTLKIGELLVSAVTGMAGSGAVTDSRAKLPVGGDQVFNTLGFNRLTAGSTTSMSTLLSDIDGFLRRGYQNYTDFDVLGSDPAAPGASKVRFFHKGGVFYFMDSSAVVTPVGSGSGGGAGASWYEPDGLAPIKAEENGQRVFLFSAAGSDKLILWIKVPSGYLTGRPITLKCVAYSPSTSNNFKLQTVSTLIRKGTDAVSSVTNQYTSTNTAITNAVANRMNEVVLDLTSTSGGINSVAVSPGDMIKIELTRGTDTDTADVRFVSSAAELLFQ